MIEQIALERGHEIVCKIDIDNPDDFDTPEFESADVAIEFTNPMAAYDNYLKAFKHHVKVVSGSTGWMKDHKADVEALCKDGKNTLFWASNYSVGMAIFEAVNKYLAKIMNGFKQYEVDMVETHHIHKLDAPSGTAIQTAAMIAEVRAEHKQGHPEEKEKLSGARGADYEGMHIHSVRLPGYVAHQEVIFGGLGQTLTIRHDSLNRESFMPGVCLAAKKVRGLSGLTIGLDQLLEF